MPAMLDVLPLFPTSQPATALHGLYLALNLHRQAVKPDDILIYANYIASVDGRISLRDKISGEQSVPANLANKRDWRLYQELAAQSDIMLTSARYFRQLAKGNAQDLLPVGTGEAYADLAIWRQQQGLTPQPDVAIISNSLNIPLQAFNLLHDRRIFVFTSQQANQDKIHQLTEHGVEVIMAGVHQVRGTHLRAQLIQRNYRSAYMIAGPEVHRTLINDRVLDRLFLTTRFNLLGSNDFHSILNGHMAHPTELALRSLYLDQHAGSQQLFAQYIFNRREKKS